MILRPPVVVSSLLRGIAAQFAAVSPPEVLEPPETDLAT